MSFLLLNSEIQGEQLDAIFDYRWQILGGAELDVEYQWRILSAVNADFEYRWGVQRWSAYLSGYYRWNVGGFTERDFEYKWRIAQGVEGKIRHEFTLAPMTDRVYRKERLG